ncbi:MAG: YdiY family protein [Phycisphaerales bacterium]
MLHRRTTGVALTLAIAGPASLAAANCPLDADSLTLQDHGDAGAAVAADLDGIMLATMQDGEPMGAPAWESKVVAGGSGSFGNTDTQDVFVTFATVQDRGDEKTTIDAGYFYGASDGDRTDNEFTAGIRNEWFMPDSPWSIFAQGRYEYDEFQSWEHRVSVAAGFGYTFVDTDETTFIGRIGIGGSHEFNGPDDDFKPEGLIGFDFRHKLSENTEFTADSTLYPDLGDIGEFRTISHAGISILLDEELNMSFNAGLEHEHQSEIPAPNEKNDYRVTFGLSFEF